MEVCRQARRETASLKYNFISGKAYHQKMGKRNGFFAVFFSAHSGYEQGIEGTRSLVKCKTLNMKIDDHVKAGQSVYTPLTLKLYDWFVLGFSNRMLWRCPTSELLALYARNASGRHLDVGVGTGYFLDRTKWPVSDPQITLIDLNSHSLEAVEKRIDRFSPRSIVANILEPLSLEQGFDSVGLCYLLHCLPGTLSQKSIVFDHVLSVMSDSATVFGATIVQGDAPRSRAARTLMNFYNRKGIFSNEHDTYDALKIELDKRFASVKLHRHGAVVTFEAKGRKV